MFCALQAEQLAEDELKAAEQTLFADLTSFGKGFTVVERVRLAPAVCGVLLQGRTKLSPSIVCFELKE